MPSEGSSSFVDTVVVGNGPAALILSFVLHGNVPYYNSAHPHPDPILHAKLVESPCLLDLDVDDLTAHFEASRISYSTQALPVNVLLDTLLRPLADVEPGEHASSVIWKKQPARAVSHLVFGSSPQAGGQWADNPVKASWDIGALSYLDQLSLPGYTLYDYLGISPKVLQSCTERPTRRQLTDYFAAYPAAVGIQDAMRSLSPVSGISRTVDGFYIASHGIRCKNLVLASGVFTDLLNPPPALSPLNRINEVVEDKASAEPLLIIGSGFSAADIIISNVQKRKVLHLFRWQPDKKPSPLQACHPQAYPDYAGVYRQMKHATEEHGQGNSLLSPTPRKLNPFFDEWVWKKNYEGFPNASIKAIEVCGDKATVVIESPGEGEVEREVQAFAYVIGRRGSLGYLDKTLQLEVLDHGEYAEPDSPAPQLNQPVSGSTLREKTIMDVEVTNSVFAVGSLTGDSLIRFAYGSCVQAAGKIITGSSRPTSVASAALHSPKRTPERRSSMEQRDYEVYQLTNGHEELGRSREAEKDLNSEEEDSIAGDAETAREVYNSSQIKPSRKSCIDFGSCIVS